MCVCVCVCACVRACVRACVCSFYTSSRFVLLQLHLLEMMICL